MPREAHVLNLGAQITEKLNIYIYMRKEIDMQQIKRIGKFFVI